MYVERFDVILPDEFLATAARNNYVVPEFDAEALDDGREIDLDFWTRWCHVHARAD